MNTQNWKRFVVWGYKDLRNYHTHTHIHEAFYRAFKFMGLDAYWLDKYDDISQIDFANTFFITEHVAALDKMPVRNDCFYAIHGLNDTIFLHDSQEYFHPMALPIRQLENRLSWNVYPGGLHEQAHDVKWVGEDMPFSLSRKHMEMRWATDIFPVDIERNKIGAVCLRDTRNINFVGSIWWMNEKEIREFERACTDNGVVFCHANPAQGSPVSVEENIKLIRESMFAPALQGQRQIDHDYAPCRLFKNISYGHYGVTNSINMNRLFGGKLVYHPDSYKLFTHALEELKKTSQESLFALMDEVAQKHTYLNRLDGVFQAANEIMNQ